MGMLFEPMKLMALRFFAPNTAPKPLWPVTWPASCTMHDTRARFSPAGPRQMTEGRCVVRPPSRAFVSSYHEPGGVPCVTSSQMRSWHSKASRPQRSAASLNSTRSFTTLIHTGASALPRTTQAS